MPTTAADQIRSHLQSVAHLRQQVGQSSADTQAVHTVKRLQARRFRATYSDLSGQSTTRPAIRFFLDELYGDHDFSERDAQFARIAGSLERFFPEAVSQVAVDLAEMHALTEQLDHRLAKHWTALPAGMSDSERYLRAWRLCAGRPERERQLAVVQQMGRELQALTRMRSLRMGLRLMRKPAQAAGLESLQRFLEGGFDAFAALGDATPMLRTIATRETAWLDVCFDAPLDEACRLLDAEWARATP